ncbi:MAG TPA: hypothetical protein VN025_15455 [Candidatus Dormibacteraeota bacterium]|jgi:hypothetical protein|nr:hypothetical protein [Candidatus Dormibacteraeota bacterium]
MLRKISKTIALTSLALIFALSATSPAQAQDAKTPYPNMAPLDLYLIADRDSEISLARSAAPESISRDAEVMVLTRHGYETAVKGKNGFVCIVWRSWAAGFDDPEFWNPKLRAPVCFNPPAARFSVPLTIKKTGLVLAGRSKAQMLDSFKTAFDKKELSEPESGAMCFMLSKQGYLNDHDGNWHPHLMFFAPATEPALWSADVPGSPVIVIKDTDSHFSLFLVPVTKWSDGTPAPPYDH